MKSAILSRVGRTAAIVLVTAGAVVLGATAAHATPPPGTLGTLTTNPATGSDVIVPQVITSAGCPAAADAYNVFVAGPVFSSPVLITQTQSVNLSHSGGFSIQLGESFKDLATDNGTALTVGEYDITANCVDSFSLDVLGTFTTAVYFTSPTAYQSTDPNAPIPTTTALAVAPPSPVLQGTSVTLTATISPSTATGTVQFFDGANPLGSPATVSGGSAALSTLALTAGTHSLTAQYIPTGSFVGSTSSAVSYQVNTPVATPTTTALLVNPSGSVEQFTTVSLTATVSPSAAAGTIQFTNGGSPLGSPVPLASGSATLATATLSVGSHSFTAQFTPTSPAAFVASESDPVALNVTPFAGSSTSENISTTVLSGALVISVDNANVTLPSPQLTTDGSLLTTTGALNPITVTDTRAGNPGWNVSGQVSDFSDGASHSINGANLGWTPNVVDHGASQTVTPGPVVNPANGLAPGASAPPGIGLATGRTLATAAAAAGIGTAHLSANVALNVPTTTVAGTYSATLTITAI